MDIVGAEAEFVAAEARKFWRDQGVGAPAETGIGRPPARVVSDKSGKRKTENGDFTAWPLAVQRKVLQQQLTSLGLRPDFELIEQLRKAPGEARNVSAGLSVARDAEGRVVCRSHLTSGFNPAELALKLASAAGRAKFGGHEFHWQVEQVKKPWPLRPKRAGGRAGTQEYFDADKVGGRVALRHWRPGDRFQPIGLKSAVKLQDLFVNAKIPAARRRALVLAVAEAGDIFWVEGLRIGERCKLTPATGRRLRWEPKFQKIDVAS
jgi:tRNA(Ile)-lysidine synthase